MAKKEYYFQGKSKYSKVLMPDLEYQCWSQPLYLTQESYEQFMKLKEPTGEIAGIMNEVKKEEDGYFVNFRRPMTKTYQGKLQSFAPPVVVDKDGKPWEGRNLIGNGSDLTVKVEWYPFTSPFTKKKGSAIRLVSVRVDNLVPYEAKKDYSDIEVQAVKGLDTKPAVSQNYF